MNMIKMTLVSLIAVAACTQTDPQVANESAKEFARNIPNSTGTNCVNSDSDGDGYCSCSVFRNGEPVPLTIQCGCERFCIWNCARGCKFVESVKVLGR